jgi:hypothetical protein
MRPLPCPGGLTFQRLQAFRQFESFGWIELFALGVFVSLGLEDLQRVIEGVDTDAGSHPSSTGPTPR